MTDIITGALPDEIVNFDIVSLCQLLGRGMSEIANSTSATLNGYREADLVRVEAIMAKFARRFETDATFPEVDLPKYTPERTAFPKSPQSRNELPLQNTDAQDLLNNMGALFVEMAKSDSNGIAAGFLKADAARVRVMITKINQNVADIRDFPETDMPDAPDQVPHDA